MDVRRPKHEKNIFADNFTGSASREKDAELALTFPSYDLQELKCSNF